MSDVWGNRLKISIFGESHGPAIGAVIDGLPSGLEIDMPFLLSELKRRAPGNSKLTTKRKESDTPEILSGFLDGKTTGAALCFIIKNTDMRSRDYSQIDKFFRPSHADYPAFVKYNGFEDIRGGGHFSGRITAPLVFVGAICKQILLEKNIRVYGRISEIAAVADIPLSDEIIYNDSAWQKLREKTLACFSEEQAAKMEEAILAVAKDENSLGGIAEIVALGLEAGIGEPFFSSIESKIASLAFSVPAVKGIEFGAGFAMAKMTGAQANDAYFNDNGVIRTKTNHNGGILGGISTGMPLIFRAAIKPTASISREQDTVEKQSRQNAKLRIEGRHDPCIVPRALPVLEAITAIALCDFIL